MMARSGSKKARERRERQAPKPATPKLTEAEATAIHEAGHTVAAHALGRRCVYVRSVSRLLPVGHPHNPYPHALRSAGFHLSEPLLAREISEQHAAGLPLTSEHVDWLRQEAILTLAGPMAEGNRYGDEVQGDLEAFGNVAGMLGRVEDRGEDSIVEATFQEAAAAAAGTILVDLRDTMLEVANGLLAAGELDEPALAAALAGSPIGSHRHLLDTLETSGIDS